MAKITPGALVGEIRNALGGMVFSRNTYGAFIRNNVVPVNPNTDAQTAVRAGFSQIAQAWRSLSDAQRAGWVSAAAAGWIQTDVFGSQFHLTGFGLFMKLNTSLRATQGASPLTLDAVPAEESVEGMVSVTPVATVSMGTFALAVTTVNTDLIAPDTVPTNRKMIFSATAPMSAGKRFSAPLYKQIDVQAASSTSPYALATAYQAVFGAVGALNDGQRINVKAVLVSTISGQRGVEVSGTDLIVSS